MTILGSCSKEEANKKGELDSHNYLLQQCSYVAWPSGVFFIIIIIVPCLI